MKGDIASHNIEKRWALETGCRMWTPILPVEQNSASQAKSEINAPGSLPARPAESIALAETGESWSTIPVLDDLSVNHVKENHDQQIFP